MTTVVTAAAPPAAVDNALAALKKAGATTPQVQLAVAWSLIQLHQDLVEILAELRNPAHYG